MKKTIILIATSLCFSSSFAMNNYCTHTLATVKDLPTNSKQVLVVKGRGSFSATMMLCERKKKNWYSAVYKKPFAAVLGKNGLAYRGEKKEGDYKTPVGLYPIGEAFGTKKQALKMDYRFITKQDKFVDDMESPQYNTWVVGKTKAKSYEDMLIDPYELGAVLNYNMNPAIPGKGSAIFLHLWGAPNKPTAGCVATDREHLLTILKWLEKEKLPYIYVKQV